MEELAEVLAVDFDDEEGIPKLNANWRWEDEEQALLTSCSSLIAIVEANDSRVVQFSHFSVKEFLTSTRLETSSKDLFRYHIDLEPAHTILAQACMGVLLQSDDCVEENSDGRRSSLAKYAAHHWVTHAQFESVSHSLRKAMECLFDLDKPYFAAWLEIHDIDIKPGTGDSSLYWITLDSRSTASPLYYAALCGLQGLVEHLVVESLQDVNASGGWYMRPLVAALARRHFQTAEFLRHNGAHANVRGKEEFTPLHSAAWYGDLKMVQTLIDYEADVHDQNSDGYSPMHLMSFGFGSESSSAVHDDTQSLVDVARLLLEHGVDVNVQDFGGKTPLHAVARIGRMEVMRVLLEHGAIIDAEDKTGGTPLHEAVEHGDVEVMRVLLGHGANIGAEDKTGRTPLHEAVRNRNIEVMRVLLEHGANIGAGDKTGRTSLHEAAEHGVVEVMRVLLEHGANIGAEDKTGRTPLHEAAGNRNIEAMCVLLEHGANIGAEDKTGRTSLHEAAEHGDVEVMHVLLKHDADVGAEDKEGKTAFRIASLKGYHRTMKLLSNYGAKGMFSVSTSSLCLPW